MTAVTGTGAPARAGAAPPGSPSWLPFAAALVTVTLWASAFVGIRAAGRAFSPGALALGRLLIGTLLLGLFLAGGAFCLIGVAIARKSK